MKMYILFLSIFVVMGLAGCATQVIRKEPAEVVDLSGRWNDTDARMAAEEMIKECTAGGWIGTFNKDNGRDPVVIIGSVVNRSHEHIDSNVFVQDLEQALVNSGKVKFVADKSARTEIREERMDQQVNSSEVTRAKLINESGADFMLQGTVNSVKDETKGQYAILFQVNLELVNLSTNEKVWLGQKKIKKLVKNPKYSM
ncbi:MAG: penicillin-binding protein activator LpoB [Candidatus Omnitrophica bacterium]|nr:penicillin-binding protein activator LpoB [Candidatus Omnitrophota bacterium]